jgi:hypothetical protein
MRRTRTGIDAVGQPVVVGLSLSLLAGALGAAGCGLVAGVDFGSVQPRGSGGAGSSGTESTSNTGGASATGSTGDSTSSGITSSGTGTGGGGSGPDAPCDPAETPLATGIFVSPTGDGMTGNGSAAAPFKTITAAMAAAAMASGGVIYLDQGTYAETVAFTGTVASGVTIDGSWARVDLPWKRRCGERDKTVIAAPSAVAMTVVDAGTKSGLSNLTLQTKSPGASLIDQDGESTVGIFARGTGTFTLFNVEVKAGDAGPGGAPPPTFPVPPQGCSGTPPECSKLPPIGTGSMGGPGAPGGVGTFGPNGYAVTRATMGMPGGAGANGSAGGSGFTLTGCTADCSALNDCSASLDTSVTSEPGYCGCGGAGGAAGKPGHGGGASVGVLVEGAYSVTIDYCLIEAGHGGAGSDGAAGSVGGQSTSGMAGADASCHMGGCTGQAGNCHFSDGGNGTVVGGGFAGSAGVPGGVGGKGGGGAGGPSYSVVSAGGGTAHVLATSKLSAAGGGAGQSGAPAGDTALQHTAP